MEYVGGQLRIDASNVTLAELLNRVTALTGVKFDVPPEANESKLPTVKLGPGPAREVLAALLSGSHLNYLIQEADGNPEKIQAVLIMAPEKKGRPGEPNVQASGSAPLGRPQVQTARVEEPPAAASAPAPVDPGPGPQAAPPQTPEQPTALASAAQPGMMNGARSGPLTPPAVLSPQSISQQLQQMYQQRMQMNQQESSAAPVAPSKL